MNQFKALDNLFPCGKDRLFGEVVSINVLVSLEGIEPFNLNGKRKAWYVNASVNAWHLHRHLCKELSRNLYWIRNGSLVSRQEVRSLKRGLSDLVRTAYFVNYSNGTQGFEFRLGSGHHVSYFDDLSSTTLKLLTSPVN